MQHFRKITSLQEDFSVLGLLSRNIKEEVTPKKLGMYVENDRDLYLKMKQPLVKNLLKMVAAKKYSYDESKKMWKEFVQAGAKKYEDKFDNVPESVVDSLAEEYAKAFEQELAMAVKISQMPDAPLSTGDHCRWCAAKPTCPKMTGLVERSLHAQLDVLNVEQIAGYLKKADMLEQWVTDVRALAHQILDAGKPVPGFKLVAKRATRQWADEEAFIKWANKKGLDEEQCMDKKLKSPAAMEKIVGKKELPTELIVAVSSGSTLVEDSDPRPAVLQIGQQLTAALSKLQ